MLFASNSLIVKSLSHDSHVWLSSFLSYLHLVFLFILLHRVKGKSYLVWNYSPRPQDGKTELYLWEILGNLTVQDTWHQYKICWPSSRVTCKKQLAEIWGKTEDLPKKLQPQEHINCQSNPALRAIQLRTCSAWFERGSDSPSLNAATINIFSI